MAHDNEGFCAGCGCSLEHAPEIHTSSIFSPTEQFELCPQCGRQEEAEIDKEGTNNLPTLLAIYKGNAARINGDPYGS